MKLSEEIHRQARTLIAERLGLDFPDGRLAELEQGFDRALRSSSVSTPEAFLAWLASLPAESPEWRHLAAQLTVGETYFFRDPACFEALQESLLPELVAARRSGGLRRLRFWSAACATGEEPYSLAILLDRLLPDRTDWVVTILATDISPRALETARRGRYREWSFRTTSPSLRQRYFRQHKDGTFELDSRIRSMVTFAPLNLAADGYPSLVTNTAAMDLIMCRNVLMYFTREAQLATVARLRRALVPAGWLVVNPAEASSELLRPLAAVNFAGAIFYRKGEAAARPSPPAAAPADLMPSPRPVTSSSDGPAVASPDATTDLERARVLADQGQLEQARRLCQAALARDRLDADAHLLLAAIHQEQGEIQAAVEALRRAIYVAPDSAPAHFLMGSLLLRQGQRRRARRSLEAVVSLLSPLPRDDLLPGSDGVTAGRLLETARAYLEVGQ